MPPSRRVRSVAPLLAAWLALALTLPALVSAQTRTWSGASSSVWNTAGNWSGSNTPNSTAETAAFGTAASNRRSLTFSNNTDFDLGGITFNAGANAFTLTLNASSTLRLNTAGIVDNSTAGQTVTNRGLLEFYNSASAGNSDVTLRTLANTASAFAETNFHGSSTAGSATLVNTGSGTDAWAIVSFYDTSTAGSATITTNGTNGYGSVDFYDDATAGSATLTFGANGYANFNGHSTAGSSVMTFTEESSLLNFNEASTAGSATITAAINIFFGGTASADHATITMNSSLFSGIFFDENSTAGSAAITLNDAVVEFAATSTAGSSTLRLDATSAVYFHGGSTGGTAALVLQEGAVADFSGTSAADPSIGSLEGSGFVFLGSNQLSVGGDHTSTTFSGPISDAGGSNDVAGGGLEKIGTGTLTLSSANSFTGSTIVSTGTLLVDGSLATTVVTVAPNATLGGHGTIGGLTVVASGAHLAPGNTTGTLTFTHGLTFEAGAILDFQLGSMSDLIRVSGGTLSGPAFGTITLNLSDAGGFDPLTGGTFTLFDFSGATLDGFDASQFTFGTLLSGTTLSNYSLSLDPGTNALRLTYAATASAIPEPSTYAALFGAVALAFALHRRRRAA